MKLLLSIVFIIMSCMAFSQEKEIHIQAQITDENSKPVEDAYVVNNRNLDKAVSQENGVFDIWVLPDDLIRISHISYQPKIVRVFDLMKNPVVKIALDTVNIVQVDISPNQKTDYQRAKENMSFLSEIKIPKFEKIKSEEPLVNQMMAENNNVMYSNKTSLSMLRFSPSEIIKDFVIKFEHREKSDEYSSQKNNNKNYP